jgi:hypothetical protein
MKLSNEQLDSFIAVYKQEYGITIDRAEAERQAMALITLVRRIYRPMTKEKLKQVVAKMLENE